MDNQQVTSINDNYFAGLIDSDFGVFITKNNYKGKLMIRPVINFVNTRFELIETCSSFLLQNGINHHVSMEKSTVGRDHKRIKIQRLSKCIEFVDKFSHLSVVRRPQMELLREFCEGRVEYVENFGWRYNNTPYTERQLLIFDEIQQLNLNYNRDDCFRNRTFSWLAGMVDGDGSIYFSDSSRDTKYKETVYRYRKITPYLKITTESDTALSNIKEMYDSVGVRYYVEKSRGKVSKKLKKRSFKYYYSISVKEFKDLGVVLNKLNGKLVAKQKQLELVLEYLNVKNSDIHYSQEVYDLVNKVKDLNTNY
jgi:hypothetical protein